MVDLLVDNFDNLLVDCDGNLLVCDPMSENRYCCLGCNIIGDDDFNSMAIVPCGNLQVVISGAADLPAPNTLCEDCDNINGTYEISPVEPLASHCGEWSASFTSVELCDGNFPMPSGLIITVSLGSCCDHADNPGKNVIFLQGVVTAPLNVVQATAQVVMHKKLAEFDIVAGGCEQIDWSNPNETLSYTAGPAGYCGKGGYHSEEVCDLSGLQMTITKA